MTYISLAAHNNELFIIKDMETFTGLFCYLKKQRRIVNDTLPPASEKIEDTGITRIMYEIDTPEAVDVDDIL